jgi:hypothetical protein
MMKYLYKKYKKIMVLCKQCFWDMIILFIWASGILAVGMIVFFSIEGKFGQLSAEEKGVYFSTGAVIIAVIFRLFQKKYEDISRKMGAYQAIIADILAIHEALAGFGIEEVSELVKDADKNPGYVKKNLELLSLTRENYIEVFQGQIQNLHGINPDTLGKIITFYTTFKASRDAALALSSWHETMGSKNLQFSLMRMFALLKKSAEVGDDICQESRIERPVISNVIEKYKKICSDLDPKA